MGLVNIVTRRSGQRVFARASTHEAYSAGASLSLGAPTGWRAALSLAGWTSDRGELAEPRRADEQRLLAAAEVARGGLSLRGTFAQRDLDQTGTPAGATPLTQEQRHATVEARCERRLSAALRGELRAGWRHNHAVGGGRISGDIAEASATLHGETGGRHRWLADVAYKDSHIDEALFAPPGTPPGRGLRLQDERRRILSATLQDAFDVLPALTVTAGARLDDYDDLGTRVTPRAAAVWRATPSHIFKLQYAEGFRPPTFFEFFSQREPDIEFEVNATTELNYVFRRQGRVLRATLFHSELRDMIYVRVERPGAPPRFGNYASARARGAELEWEQELGRRVKATAQVSWVDTRDRRTPRGATIPSPAAADWLWNLTVSARPMRAFVVSGRWNHVGDRNGAGLPGYELVDLSVTRSDLFAPGLQLRLGVKNAAGERVVHPLIQPTGIVPLVFPGRSAWVQLAYSR
jgi:outer membrane receptor protein involved in Fe transport